MFDVLSLTFSWQYNGLFPHTYSSPSFHLRFIIFSSLSPIIGKEIEKKDCDGKEDD